MDCDMDRYRGRKSLKILRGSAVKICSITTVHPIPMSLKRDRDESPREFDDLTAQQETFSITSTMQRYARVN